MKNRNVNQKEKIFMSKGLTRYKYSDREYVGVPVDKKIPVPSVVPGIHMEPLNYSTQGTLIRITPKTSKKSRGKRK